MKFCFLAVCLAVFAIGSTFAPQPVRAAQTGLVICIDPGHPSESGRGTSGRHITEMQAVWREANAMRKILEADEVRVVMTKTSESEYVTNKDRAGIANAAHADLMVRLHCDGGAGIGSGFAVYCPDRRGRADGAVGPSPDIVARSQAAGKEFYAIMVRDLSGKFPARGLHPDTATHIGAGQGALTGSVFSQVPVVLIEMCVLTNPKDESWIISAEGSQAMAAALADAAQKAARAVSSK